MRFTVFVGWVQHVINPIRDGSIRAGMDFTNGFRVLVPAVRLGNGGERRPSFQESVYLGPVLYAAGRAEGGLPRAVRAVDTRGAGFGYDLKDCVTGR